MTKSIVVCGDSFNIGIGCKDLANEPYGQIISKALNRPIINLAKGSSTNLSIFLQVKYALEKFCNDIEYVFFSHTSYDRVDWFPVDSKLKHGDLSLCDVNYHQYPPYGKDTYCTIIDRPMKNDLNYNGEMFTENIRGVIDYWETFRSNNKESGYYSRFKYEPKDRMKIMYDYGLNIMDQRIVRLQSISLTVLAHTILKSKGIKHLLLTHEPFEYSKYMPEENIVNVNWGELSLSYPDELATLHTSAEGHKVVADKILDKMNKNNWKQ